MRSKKHFPPSRLRYERGNPVVSIRVTREVYGRLKELKERSGKSVGDVLREAIGVQARSTGIAQRRGYQSGWREAEELYRVDYRCSRCGGSLTINSDQEKQAILGYMRVHGWAHYSCSR